MRRRRSNLLVLTISWVSLLSTSAFAQTADKKIHLPHPSGRYGVARVGYDWIDRTRAEKYATDPAARREIMVYVWYPTERGLRQSAFSEYLPHAEAIAKSLKGVPSDQIAESWGDSWANIFSGRVGTDTYEQAPIVPGSERFPLLIFSPGFTVPSTSYTTLIEEIVSQGYVVASIEPTYDVAAVAFPDGRVIPFKAQWQPGVEPPAAGAWQQFLDRVRAFNATHAESWASDIRFVIDRLTSLEADGRAAVVPFAGRIDVQKIGTWGHSMGGVAAARACQLDSRIRICLDADGGTAEEASLPSQPFMWIDVYHEPPSDAQLAIQNVTRKEWAKYHQARIRTTEEHLKACPEVCYRLIIKIAGTNHYTFTDAPLVDAANKEDFDAAARAVQPIDAYTIAFFDKYLRHHAVSLLDQPSTAPRGITLEKYGKGR
jgi:predicted dienelactone hydrolase